jgi:hypothetical protein
MPKGEGVEVQVRGILKAVQSKGDTSMTLDDIARTFVMEMMNLKQ